MIKCAAFGEKTFSSQKELFKALLTNEGRIIAIKKSIEQKSIDKGQLTSFELFKTTEETKQLLGLKSDYVYPVINTTRYMDSHEDVHFDGIWDKSIKEQQGKLYYVADHELSTTKVIAWPEDVEAMIKTVPWSFVGKNYEGNTQALIYGIAKNKLVLDSAIKIIDERRKVQNSIKMQYVTIKLAINSNDLEFKAHRDYYEQRVNEIANKEVPEEKGFFWGIEEAKAKHEGSMVLFGSNDATPIKYTEADTFTEDYEPSKDTRIEQLERIKLKF